MSLLKILLKLVAALILTVVIAIGALFAFVDPNDYRQNLTDLVKEQTGRELTIEKMHLSLYPNLAIQLEQARLSNAPNFGQTPMLRAQQVDVGVALLPLFEKRLQIKTVLLDGLKINLQKTAEGQTNWADLQARFAKPDAPDAQTEKEPSNPLEQLAALSFEGLEIQNAQLSWEDLSTGQNLTILDLNLRSDEMQFDHFFTIEARAKTELQAPQLNNDWQFKIEAKISQDGNYTLRNLTLENTLQSQALPIDTLVAKLSIPTLDLQLSENLIHLPNVTLETQTLGKKDFSFKTLDNQLKVQALKLNLETLLLQASTLSLQTQAQGQTDFAIHRLNSVQTLEKLSFDITSQQLSMNLSSQTDASGPALPAPVEGARLNSQIKADLKAQTLSMPDLKIQALNTQIQANVQVKQLLDGAQVKSDLAIATFNPKQLLETLKIALPPMADNQRLQQAELQAKVDFNLTQQALQVTVSKLLLDQSTLKGQTSVKNFTQPQVRFDLALDQIDLNAYLPPKPPKSDEPASKPDEDIVISLPTELLRSLDLQGTLKVGSLKFEQLQPKNLLLNLSAAKGDLKIRSLKADIFSTTLSANASLNVSQTMPSYTLQLQAPKVPVGELLLAFTGDDKLRGLGNLQLDLQTQGETVKQLMSQLNGRTDLDLTDGAVKGFNLAKIVREAKAKLKGETLPADQGPNQTDFSSLIAKANIRQGIATTETLSAQAPFMRIQGEGKIDLGKEALDYLVNAKIVNTSKGQGGADLEELSGLTLPVRLKGSWLNPSISLDLKSLVEERAKQALEQKKEEAIEKAKTKVEEKKTEVIEETKKKVEDQLKDALKGFKF
ncbi:MAG: AsmA family protein [Thiotrichales bacterium]|nr:AsmA family protein [Thiotrichales bacterium]